MSPASPRGRARARRGGRGRARAPHPCRGRAGGRACVRAMPCATPRFRYARPRPNSSHPAAFARHPSNQLDSARQRLSSENRRHSQHDGGEDVAHAAPAGHQEQLPARPLLRPRQHDEGKIVGRPATVCTRPTVSATHNSGSFTPATSSSWSTDHGWARRPRQVLRDVPVEAKQKCPRS